jgi:hypothetical protein
MRSPLILRRTALRVALLGSGEMQLSGECEVVEPCNTEHGLVHSGSA